MAEHDDHWILFRLRRLHPTRFEELCCALLRAKGHTEVRHLGASGSERGVDIKSYAPDGRLFITQCKRVRSLSPQNVRPEIRMVITEPLDPPPEIYHLVATCNVSRATEEALEDAARVAPFPLEIANTWAASELVAMLRDEHPKLREEFIGLSWRVYATGSRYERSPTPTFSDEASRKLAEALEQAQLRHEELTSTGKDASMALEEILDIKRRMREGPLCQGSCRLL